MPAKPPEHVDAEGVDNVPPPDPSTDQKRRAIERGVYARRTRTDQAAEAELKTPKGRPPRGA